MAAPNLTQPNPAHRGILPGYGASHPGVIADLTEYTTPYSSVDVGGGYTPYAGAHTGSGMTGYQSPGHIDLMPYWIDYTAQGFTRSGSGDKWYRKYRNWTNAWRRYTQQAMGMGGYQALDPLAQLQQQLGGHVDPDIIGKLFSQNYDFDPMMGAQNQALSTAIRQRAAAMGLGGAFGGVMEEAHRARSTMGQQALAAYRPQAWQAQQQIQGQTSQLLDALARAEFEAEAATEAAGRNA